MAVVNHAPFTAAPPHLELASALAVTRPEFIPYAFYGLMHKTHDPAALSRMLRNLRQAYAQFKREKGPTDLTQFLLMNHIDPEYFFTRQTNTLVKFDLEKDPPAKVAFIKHMQQFSHLRIIRSSEDDQLVRVKRSPRKSRRIYPSQIITRYYYAWPEFVEFVTDW